MTAPRRPVDRAVVSALEYMVLVQQDQFEKIPPEIAEHLHLYMICRRPRIAVVPSEFRSGPERRRVVFTAQYGEAYKRIELDGPAAFTDADIEMRSEWPYGDFEILGGGGERLAWGRSSLYLTRMDLTNEHLDLEVLYIGQAYGSSGERSAIDRLAKHETLQAIYGEAVRRSPDKEVWIVLLGLAEVYGLMVFSPVAGDGDLVTPDNESLMTGISEQQQINFTEAALIRYFSPSYNKEYKDTFPSPAHKTYSECYDLDIKLSGLRDGDVRTDPDEALLGGGGA